MGQISIGRGFSYTFPKIERDGEHVYDGVNKEGDLREAFDHAKEEMLELEEAIGCRRRTDTLEECLDVIHCLETLMRSEYSFEEIDAMAKFVEAKNWKRGYYDLEDECNS